MNRLIVAARALTARAMARIKRSPNACLPLLIVFSKDRAPQLDLFLQSFSEYVANPPLIVVMYSASTSAHHKAYEMAFQAYTGGFLKPLLEKNFQLDLIGILKNTVSQKVIFFVDDIVFIRPIDFAILGEWDSSHDGILSLRLGANITQSFNLGGIAQLQPKLLGTQKFSQDFLSWRWKGSHLDWSLPTSLDGNLFPLPEVLTIASYSEYKAPNSLEKALCQFRFLFRMNPGVCFPLSRIVNLPLNTVKTEDFKFPHLDIDPDELLTSFLHGQRLRLLGVDLDQQNSCHMPWIPKFVDSVQS